MAKREVRRVNPEVTALLRDTISPDRAKAVAACDMFAQALQEPLRETILSGDIYSDIFSIEEMNPTEKPMYMLDWIVPGTEADYVAYVVPAQGELPRKLVNGDYVEVPTYEIGASLDWNLKMPQRAGAGFMARAEDRIGRMVTKKVNDDAFHTILMACVDRNIVVYDAAAAANQFTKRLVSLAQLVMRRNAGGNSVTNNRRLTDIYMSLESFEDIRNWGIDIIDDLTRNKIFNSKEGLTDVFGVNLHPLFELGVGQEYQNYFANDLSGTQPAGDSEILIGLDLTVADSFVMPIVERFVPKMDTDERARLSGLYGFMEFGVAALDARRGLILSL